MFPQIIEELSTKYKKEVLTQIKPPNYYIDIIEKKAKEIKEVTGNEKKSKETELTNFINVNLNTFIAMKNSGIEYGNGEKEKANNSEQIQEIIEILEFAKKQYLDNE